MPLRAYKILAVLAGQKFAAICAYGAVAVLSHAKTF